VISWGPCRRKRGGGVWRVGEFEWMSKVGEDFFFPFPLCYLSQRLSHFVVGLFCYLFLPLCCTPRQSIYSHHGTKGSVHFAANETSEGGNDLACGFDIDFQRWLGWAASLFHHTLWRHRIAWREGGKGGISVSVISSQYSPL